MEEEFQFLLCEKCRREARDPKLLFCLHNLCTECLEESKTTGRCPVCQISIQHDVRAPLQDNLFFASLQVKLSTYQKITSNRDLVCNRCREAAEFWCAECDEFLCSKCHDAHQWYLKQKSHKSQKLMDLQNNTAHSFLGEARKSCNLFCSEPSHSNQVVSIYCRGCDKPLCCACALLDGEHYNAKLYSDIWVEIESRKKDLQEINRELEEKKQAYEGAHNSINERLQELDEMRNETQELIQKKVEEMVQCVRKEGDELLRKVDQHLRQEREEIKKKLQDTKHIFSRMKSSKQLIEKMNIFASDQEVLNMHPFIRAALDELRREQLPAVDVRVQTGDFAEVRSELHTLFKRVTGERDAACPACVTQAAVPAVNLEVLQYEKRQSRPQKTYVSTPTYMLNLTQTPRGFAPSITSSAKHPACQSEKSVQASPKMLKLEDHGCKAGATSRRYIQELAMSPEHNPACTSTPERKPGGSGNVVEVLVNSSPEVHGSEATSIVIGSSDENDDDQM